MKKTAKKYMSILLVLSMLVSIGALTSSSILAFAEGEDSGDDSLIITDTSDPFNPVYVDEDGNEVDMNDVYSEMAEEDTSYNDNNLPVSYDARQKNVITSVKNQDPYGTCWAHAAMNCLEADSIKKGYYTKSTADFSESHLVWFAYNPVSSTYSGSFNDGRNNRNLSEILDEGGYSMYTIAALSRGEGIAKENDYKYPGAVYNESDRFNKATGLVLGSAEYLSTYEDVKQWIIDHGSVMAAYYHDNSDRYFDYSTYSYYNNAQGYTNHEISIVGWNDNYSKNNFNSSCRPAGNGAWLVKNSWGTGWGNSGYFWLSYYTYIDDVTGFTVSKSDTINNNYTYTGNLPLATIYSKANSITLANVFTAKESEKLSRVSFYTAQPDLSVNIKVYTLSNGFSNPASGTLVSSLSKRIHNPGYYTVSLNKAVELSANQLFSVVVEYTTSSSKVYYYQELDTSSSPIKYQRKESWTYIDKKWTDNKEREVSGYDVGNNFINAITEKSTYVPEPASDVPSVKLSASPSNITLYVGETGTVRVSLSGSASNLRLCLTSYDKNYVTPKWQGSSFVSYADLNITGIKEGNNKAIVVTLYDNSSGNILDSITINTNIRTSYTPPSSDTPTIKIRGFGTNYNASYRTTFRFNADTANMPDNAIVMWRYNGTVQDVTGSPVYVNEATESFTVQAIMVQNGNIIAESDVLNVNVNSGFFARLIAFFKALFGSLPVVG